MNYLAYCRARVSANSKGYIPCVAACFSIGIVVLLHVYGDLPVINQIVIHKETKKMQMSL